VLKNTDSASIVKPVTVESHQSVTGKPQGQPNAYDSANSVSHSGLKGGQMPSQRTHRPIDAKDPGALHDLPPPPGQPVYLHKETTPLKDSAKQTWEGVKTTAGKDRFGLDSGIRVPIPWCVDL
jgi:hypothetical protein